MSPIQFDQFSFHFIASLSLFLFNNLQNQQSVQLIFKKQIFFVQDYNQIQYKQITEGMPIVLKEREVLDMVERLQHAKSKQEIKKIEERLQYIFTDQKNLTLLVNLVTSKDINNLQKNILVSFFNLIVQQQLRKYEQIKRRNRCRADFKVNDDFRRDAMTLTSKIEKVIDSNSVDVSLKPRLVYLQLKIFNRSKEDWDVSRVTNKMDFYLRKDNVQVAEAYFHNIIRLGYSTKQKVDVFRRAAQHLPKMGVKFLNKIQKFNFSQAQKRLSIYTDYKSNLSMVKQLLTLAFIECTDEIVTALSNCQMFLTYLEMISQKLGQIFINLDLVNNQNANQWSELILTILKKLSEDVIHHGIRNNCQPFVKFFTNFVSIVFEIRYIVSSHVNKYDLLFGDYLPLFINATRLGSLPRSYLMNEEEQDSLNKASKYHILNTHIIALFSYFFQKINQFLQSNIVEKQNQFLEFFNEFCSQEEIDYSSDNFQYNFCLFFFVVVKKYGKVQFFIKNLICCLLLNNKLFSDQPSQQSEVEWWFMLDQIEIAESIGDQSKRMEIGIFLCLILYKELQKDRIFVENCIKKFIEKVASESYNPEKSIFQGSPQTVTLFLLMFENWLEEISVFKNKNSRIQGFVFSPFVNAIASQLCTPNPNIPALPCLLLSFFLHYSQLIKQIIRSYKRSPIFKNYSNSISFSQLSIPLQQLHRYEQKIPVRYYCQLYQNIIQFDIFRLQGEKREQTTQRAKAVIQKIIFHQIEQKEKAKYYFHEAFKVFETLVSCEEYQVLFADLFAWITESFNPKSLLEEYQQDIINLCLIVLEKPSFLLGLNRQTLQKFWQLVYKLLQKYQWREYNDQQQKQLMPDIQKKNFAAKQLELIYLTSSFVSFKEIKDVILSICIKSLRLINSSVLSKKREMRIQKFRPYQLQEIAYLLTLHRIIQIHHQELTQEIIQQILRLYWKNNILRVEFPDDFNYVHGKYNLLILLLIRYSYDKFTTVLYRNNSDSSNKIFYEIFFYDKLYRVDYDSPWFVYHTTQIVSKLWSPKYHVKDCQLILKYAHFAVGACIFILDRVYQRHRFNKQQDLEVTAFSQELKDPILATDVGTTKFINFLTNNQRQIDQFQCFRTFYKRIKQNNQVEDWFNESMKLYIRSQTYLDYYYDVLSVRKIRRSDGLLIYRIFNKVSQSKIQPEENLYT